MNPEVKAEWVRRLRSGDYRQGRHDLQRDGKFCCLGVLMEMAVEAGLVFRVTHPDSLTVAYLSVNEDDRFGYALGKPTENVFKWSGLSVADTDTLINMNDSWLKPFEEIADYIDEIGDDTE